MVRGMIYDHVAFVLYFKVVAKTRGRAEFIKFKKLTRISPDSNYALTLLKRDPFGGSQTSTGHYKSAPN